jgi:hypothetical protein
MDFIPPEPIMDVDFIPTEYEFVVRHLDRTFADARCPSVYRDAELRGLYRKFKSASLRVVNLDRSVKRYQKACYHETISTDLLVRNTRRLVDLNNQLFAARQEMHELGESLDTLVTTIVMAVELSHVTDVPGADEIET